MNRRLFLVLLGCVPGLPFACDRASEGENGPQPQSLAVRSQRRAFAGAPPVIPHPPLPGRCADCHTPAGGRIIPDVGISPPNPHTRTRGLSEQSRCKQCHLFRTDEEVFVASEFEPWRGPNPQEQRAFSSAPPVVPHGHFLREDCQACHTGPAARPEILCRHAERIRCQQCHVGRAENVVNEVLRNEQFGKISFTEPSGRGLQANQKPHVAIR